VTFCQLLSETPNRTNHALVSFQWTNTDETPVIEKLVINVLVTRCY